MTRPIPLSQLLAMLLASSVASATSGCRNCEPVEHETEVVIDDRCTTGKCAAWRTGPCEETCAAFLPRYAVELTRCSPPERPADADGVVISCVYVDQTCTTEPSLGHGRPQARAQLRGPAFARDPIGRFFAVAAETEESSVFAFEELAVALVSMGEASLAARCRRAAREEEEHRRRMTALARSHGVEPARAEARASRWISIETMAEENVRTGCVFELWSAALTLYAARFATDTFVRRAVDVIAVDEIGHAELAEDIHEALVRRLDHDAMTRLTDVRRDAERRLMATIDTVPDTDPRVGAGLLPSRAVRHALASRLFSDSYRAWASSPNAQRRGDAVCAA